MRILDFDKRYAVDKNGAVFSRAVGGWPDRFAEKWRRWGWL